MRRRDFLGVLSATAFAWPPAALAQTPRRIGVLMANYSATDQVGLASVNAFEDRLQSLGWTNGGAVRIDYRWDGGNAALMKAMAAELVRSAPDIIVVATDPAVAELRRLTDTIPLVFTRAVDPVGSGLVADLARPGGNVTGFQTANAGLGSKWVEVLHEIDPTISRIAVLYGSDSTGDVELLHVAEAGAKSLGVQLTAIDVRGGTELDQVLSTFSGRPGGALIVVSHPWINANRKKIISLAQRYRLPAIYGYRYFAAEGGLIAYGPDQIDQWRGAASYAARILMGEKPSELPVQAPTKYELVVNLKAAKAIGLSVPPTYLEFADEVIE